LLKSLALRLSTLDFWLVLAAVVVSTIYSPLLPAAAGLAVLSWLVRWAATGKAIPAAPLNLPTLLVLIVAALSLFVTPFLNTSLSQALRLLCGVLLCFSLVQWAANPRRISGLLIGLCLLALLLAAGALVFVNWADKFSFLPVFLPNILTLVFADSIHPNVMGGILTVLCAGMAAFLAFRWSALRRPARLGLLLGLGFASGVLFFTQSRTALVALAAALALVLLLRFRRGWIPVSLGLVLALVLLFQVGPQRVWEGLGSATGGTGSFTAREEIWLRARLILHDFPLTGVGMGAFTGVTDALYPLAATPLNIPHAHNLFLQVALDLGLPGLVAWLGCWFSVLGMAWQLYRRPPGLLQAVGAAALCAQCALGVHGLLDAVTWDTRPAVIVWAIWGLTAASWRLHRRLQALPERTRLKVAFQLDQ